MKRTFELYLVGSESDTRVAIAQVAVEILDTQGPTVNRESLLNAIERAIPGLQINGGAVHHVRVLPLPEEEAAVAVTED